MILLKNNAQSLLAQSITAMDTQLRVNPGDGDLFPLITLPGTDWFRGALSDNAGNTEFVTVIATNSDVLTIARGQEGSMARPWPAGTRLQLRMTAETWREMAGQRWFRLRDAAGNAIAPQRLSDSSLRLSGDWTEALHARRGLRVPGDQRVYFITSSLFDGSHTTVAVDGTLPASLAALDLGLEQYLLPEGFQLSDAVDSDSSGTAASSRAVRLAWNKALEVPEQVARAGSLARAMTIRFGGDVLGECRFDGSKDVSAQLALAGPGGGTIQPGMFALFLHRRTELPSGWYYPSGDYVAQNSAIGQALLALPAQLKADWGIMANGNTIRLCDNAKFFSGSYGRFPRFANNSNYYPGTVQNDAIREISGSAGGSHTPLHMAAYNPTTGVFGRGSSGIFIIGSATVNSNALTFNASGYVPTAAENRPYATHFTPAIYLGV